MASQYHVFYRLPANEEWIKRRVLDYLLVEDPLGVLQGDLDVEQFLSSWFWVWHVSLVSVYRVSLMCDESS
jgi:hypothetical protein